MRHWSSLIRSIQFSPEEKVGYFIPLLEHKENCIRKDEVELTDVDVDGKITPVLFFYRELQFFSLI